MKKSKHSLQELLHYLQFLQHLKPETNELKEASKRLELTIANRIQTELDQ